MSLLFKSLFRLVIAFLSRSKRLLISWLQSPSAVILEPPQNKISHCFHCFPSLHVIQSHYFMANRWGNNGNRDFILWFPKGNQPSIFIGRTDAEAEASILWPQDVKSWLTRKDPDAGKDWRQEEKGMTEDQMVGLHHLLNEHEFAQTPRDGEGQGCLLGCNPFCCIELDMTEWLSNNNSSVMWAK